MHTEGVSDLRYLVTCVKRYGAERTYYMLALDGSCGAALPFSSKLELKPGEVIEAETDEGKVQSFSAVEGEDVAKGARDAVDEAAKRMVRGTVLKTDTKELDAVSARMRTKLEEAALLLARKLVMSIPVVVRFHNDIDGSSGAYSVYKGVCMALGHGAGGAGCKPNIAWRMHPSVSYSKEDAINDVLACGAYEPMERPMLLVIDFGTATESNEGIEFAKGRFDIAWLDHHPLVEGFAGVSLEHYVNPWNFGGDSNYTAGFLACAFAKTLADIDLRDVQEASLAGDYSRYARPTGRSRRIAAILDLVTSDARVLPWLKGGLGADDIDRILSDEKESGELVSYAEGRMSDMLDLALNYVKVHKAPGALIYVVDFETLRGDSREKYPLPGRFASRLLGRIEELNKKDCALLLHFGYFVSIRLSKALAERAGLLELLNSIRQDYQEYVDSAGGHSTAASLKLKGDEMKKEMIKQLVDRLKERLG